MASSAVSCSSCCSTSQLVSLDLQDDSSSRSYSSSRRLASANTVATAQQLAANEALSVSEAWSPHESLLMQAATGRVCGQSEAAEECFMPLEPPKVHLRQHQQTPALAAWHTVLQTQTPANEHQLTCKPFVCRCLCLTTNSVSNAAAVAAVAPESAADQLPVTPARNSAAVESRARHVSSINSQSRLQQWLSSMELRLQVPDTQLPLESPCCALRASTLAHRDNILAYKDRTLAHRDNTLAHRDSGLADRDSSILAHSGGLSAQGWLLVQSAAVAADDEAANPAATVAARCNKRPFTLTTAAAAVLSQPDRIIKRCRTSSRSSQTQQQQQQRDLSSSSSSRTSAAAAAVTGSAVSHYSEEVPQLSDLLLPPMFVLMGVPSRKGTLL